MEKESLSSSEKILKALDSNVYLGKAEDANETLKKVFNPSENI